MPKAPVRPITSFKDWIAAMDEMVSENESDEARCTGALDIMEQVLQVADRFDLSRFVPGKTSYARHLIHNDPRDRYSLLGLVWKPGQGTPIHDHPSWGVYGVLKNRIRFTNYVLDDSGERPRLVTTGVHLATSGSAITVLPPINDVHLMANPSSEELSITLHCYGVEVKEFHVYTREGERRPATTKYDSVPA